MAGDVSSFKPNVSRGVEHLVEADIEAIRDLLRGYGSHRSILKELVQNAEDAEASRLDFIYLPPDETSKHTLTRGPGLLAINDGGFGTEHHDAIFRINLGTKATDDRAIGRFGKGLKSVFSWCEAFFVTAKTDPKLGWPVPLFTDLFNPWHGWRHANWEEEFEREHPAITLRAERHVSARYSDASPWLAFWFPLRHDSHRQDSEGDVDWIFEGSDTLPGQDPSFITKLAGALRDLAPSLVILRHLRHITISDGASVSRPFVEWHVPDSSQRIPAPDDPEQRVPVVGEAHLCWRAQGETPYKYVGLAGRLPSAFVLHLEEAHDWPRVVKRTHGHSMAGCKAKGKPHFATLITSVPTRADEMNGSLELRWCVFFPVGRQPNPSRVNLSKNHRHIVVNLHGFFFLDSERLRIDGLEAGFSPDGTASSRSCLEWNRIIATQGALFCLPRAFADFSKEDSLSVVECRELADAMRQTWVWSAFQNEVCQAEVWRPRWRHGDESWECNPASSPVLAIPYPRRPRRLLDSVPALGPISDEQILGVRGVDLAPGLYVGEFSPWPEHLALRLFESIQEETPLDHETAAWINDILDDLGKTRALTQAIRDSISDLPLLPVIDGRSGLSKRISVRDWVSFSTDGRLFLQEAGAESWLSLLCDALPQWSCFVSSRNLLPTWFGFSRLPTLDSTEAANATLKHTTLGDFTSRSKLVRALAQQPLPSAETRFAIRYLMHGSSLQARNDQSLFVPSTQHGQQIWSRLIGQILEGEGGEHSWRLLDAEWGTELSPQIQHRLGIYTVDAEGAWNELSNGSVNVQELSFSSDEWPSRDVSNLLKGLFEAGQSRRAAALAVLRKLRLHTQRGQPNERISIADRNGGLDELFVLDNATFESELPNELLPLWRSFLFDTRIVERLPENDLASTAQKCLFERLNADNTPYSAELDWNYVVRRSLALPDPSVRAPLIMEALRHGDQVARGIGQQLKSVAWLPLSLGGRIAAQSVLLIEGLEDDLHRLLDPTRDGLAGIRAVSDWIVAHPGFATLRKYFPDLAETIKYLGLWLAEKPDWNLGLTGPCEPDRLEPIISDLVEFETVPVAALLARLRSVRQRGFEVGIDPLLKEYVLPAVLKPFDYSQDGPNKLKDTLLRLQDYRSRAAFDAYLAQACTDGKIARILPLLKLVNQRGQWAPANRLTWPSTNVDEAAQLCSDHAHILTTIHTAGGSERTSTASGQSQSQSTRYTLQEPPDFDSEIAKLVLFLEPFRNGNIGDTLPAALVAVLGNHPKMIALLESLLQGTLKQRPDDFLWYLLGEKGNRLDNSLRFLVEIVRGATFNVISITGDPFTVALTQDVTTLIVGDPQDLWWTYGYYSRTTGQVVSCRLLRLRAIDDPDQLTDPVSVFATTIETILVKAHWNGSAAGCPGDLKDILGNVADAGQADLRRSRAYLLDMAEARLKELGVRGNPALDQVLTRFAAARQARVDADLLKTRMPARSKQLLEEAALLVERAKADLVALLEDPDESTARSALVEAVRRKMTDFQYDASSVLFELFQNADDASAELSEMQRGLESISTRVSVQLDGERRTLDFIHWGRPINQHECPGFRDGWKRGYDQDLQKMLTLNFSDKGVPSNHQPAIVTGRFGLGFKSVFFLADKPEIISGRLAFNICGGFFPVALAQPVAEEMRQKARKLGPDSAVPTAIRLRCAEEAVSEDLYHSINAFSIAAVLLPVFSRQIRSVVLRCDGVDNAWTNVEDAVTESANITCARVGTESFLCFRCPLSFDQHPAAVLFQLTPSGVSHMTSERAGLWITVPTAERSELLWALNAPFKPDAGRQRLALGNFENRHIAESVARLWGDSLLELFEETRTRWPRLAERLGLHADANHASWWHQIWKECTRSRPRLEWDFISDGGQVLNWIAWSKSVGAMRRLVQERPAVPSELCDLYASMVIARNIRFCVSGLLSELANGCFRQVARWESVQRDFPPGQVVSADVGAFLREAELAEVVLSVTLEQVLSSEIGPQLQVSTTVAHRIGTLFRECRVALEEVGSYASEVHHLLAMLKPVLFVGKDGAYHTASDLVCDQPIANLIDSDEVLRAEFAPDSAVLSPAYSDVALVFFIKARGQLTASATTLAAWARHAPGQKLAAIFNYLIQGDLGQQLADQLGRPWLESNRAAAAWQSISPEERNEIERKFSKGHTWQQPVSFPVSPPEPAIVRQEMDAKEAFLLVSDWWRTERAKWIATYESKTYPTGFPGPLPWPGEAAWDNVGPFSAQAGWLILFIHAALVPLGFNMIGRDQGFTQFLVDRGWLNVLTGVSENPADLLRALDQYLDRFVENTQYHFQMRQFIAFYAVAKNLDTFLLSLKEAERSESSAGFRMALAPRANFALSRTGVDAPPLTGMLGVGACHLFRELYRLGRLSNPKGYRFAFTPIRKVRRISTQLFGIAEGPTPIQSSETIFDALQELARGLGLDPTFGRCFDIPLQFLAQDGALRARVLKVSFIAESCDDNSLDAAPQLETVE